MQDRYAGDVGDFVKLGLLRVLSADRLLGVVWYRFPDEAHNGDGRHIGYLKERHRYARLDSELFDHLEQVTDNDRTIRSLLPVLGRVISFDELLDPASIDHRQRRDRRAEWFARATDTLRDCDIVFADPDNGIVDDDDHRKGRAKFGKQIPLGEVRALAAGRCAVIYHHNSRFSGGHAAEIDYWLAQFDMPAIAVRARAYSPRTFFVLNPDEKITERVRQFCHRWHDLRVELHPAL